MRVGSLVQCIDSSFPPLVISKIPNRPVKGEYYLIREIIDYNNKIGLLLEEIKNPLIPTKKGNLEPSFNISRFRVIEEADSLVEELMEEIEQVEI